MILTPTQTHIAQCAAQIRQAALVAMPTETVYGLAADATNRHAIARLYECKKRPQFNPLITHVSSLEQAQNIGVFNDTALRLAHHFWPGPLTLVLPRTRDCPVDPLACAGLETIAIRIPHHKIAQNFLSECQLPLVAPSANPSGRLSPTQATHVAQALPDIPVLDGGACVVGLESTILACLDDTPILLRAGGLSREHIETQTGALAFLPDEAAATPRLAPGRLPRHYAPRADLRLNVTTPQEDEIFLGFGDNGTCAKNLSPKADLTEAAANLFSYLHALDDIGAAKIAVAPIPNTGLGEAINDRLHRAAKRD